MIGYVILQQAVNYIEEHLLEDINYETVAKQVHMSSYEFHRAFSFISGMTANVYIRNRRLSLAGQEIMETGAKVTDMALKYGYETPESFAKAFTRFHGVAPKYAKAPGAVLKLFQPLVIKISMEGGFIMNYRMEEMPARKAIALVRAFSNETINEPGNHDIPDFWDECFKNDLIEPLRALRKDGKKDLYGLCSPTEETTFDYGIGVIIDEATEDFNEALMAEAGYRIWNIEPATFVVLECMGKDGACIGDMWERFYKEFLPQTGYEAAQTTDYEIYYEKGKKGMFCELWIPVIK